MNGLHVSRTKTLDQTEIYTIRQHLLGKCHSFSERRRRAEEIAGKYYIPVLDLLRQLRENKNVKLS